MHLPQRHAGYTLLELLLALAVLAVLVGTTVPGALRMYQDSRLSEAAESVRKELAGARTRAIESGLVYQFRYEPEGGHFAVVPFETEIEPTDANATGTGATLGVGRYSKFAGELPKGFTFVACCTSGATGGQIAEAFLQGLPNAQDLSGVSWAPPIVFAADGTAMGDAAFQIVDARKMAVRFEVRGLTGAARLGQIEPEVR